MQQASCVCHVDVAMLRCDDVDVTSMCVYNMYTCSVIVSCSTSSVNYMDVHPHSRYAACSMCTEAQACVDRRVSAATAHALYHVWYMCDIVHVRCACCSCCMFHGSCCCCMCLLVLCSALSARNPRLPPRTTPSDHHGMSYTASTLGTRRAQGRDVT